MLTLDAFCARLLSSNPFMDNRVTGSPDRDVDVGSIHQRPYEQLLDLARTAHRERRGVGVVLWGEAGVGKSHLLARLSRWARVDKHACLACLHNLQASPENLPRSLLKAVVSILTRGRVNAFDTTELFWLVNDTLRAALRGNVKPRYSRQEVEAAYRALIDRFAADPSRAALIDRTAFEVLLTFFRSASMAMRGQDDGRLAAVAVRWLAGDFLDPAEARELGLAAQPGEPVALADNQQIKQVFVALSHLALVRGQPFVLCFDQVDNLDTDQAAALSRFLEALLDSAPNLLTVVAGVQATLFRWRQDKVIQDSAWDRLGQFEVALHRVPVAEARELVAARLSRFAEPCEALDEVRRADALFPLGKPWEGEFLAGKVEMRPRDVINRAHEGWRREQEACRRLGGPTWLQTWPDRQPITPPAPPPADEMDRAIDREVAARLRAWIARREAEPYALPPDAYHLAALLVALIGQADAGLDVEVGTHGPGGARATYDLVVRGPDDGGRPARTGVACVATESAASTTAALRRLSRDRQPPERVLLVTEARVPLRPGPRGKEYLERLRRRGEPRFRLVQMTFRQYAELDALQAVVGEARSGDLEVDLPGGRSVSVREQDVVASHLRQGRYRALGVLREILGEAAPSQVGPAAV